MSKSKTDKLREVLAGLLEGRHHHRTPELICRKICEALELTRWQTDELNPTDGQLKLEFCDGWHEPELYDRDFTSVAEGLNALMDLAGHDE